MHKGLHSWKASFINYYVFGTGPEPVVCFHGYGENATSFLFLEKNAGARYTFYAIDLPYHGETKWNEGKDLLPAELHNIVNSILSPQHIGRFTLMGFSLGGRIVLSLFELLHSSVPKMILIAPDGLKVNVWYRIATQTRAGNRFFRYTMKHPKWFFILLKGMNKLKLVNSSIFKFVNHYIGDRRVREELYNRWTTMRLFRPRLDHIKDIVRKEATEVRLIYGEHDRMILSPHGKKFCMGIESTCGLKVLDCGHNVLHPKHEKEIIESLKT